MFNRKMQLRLIQKNNETILPVCFVGKNRNYEVISWHRKVMDFFEIPMNYIEWDFSRSGHGDAIQWLINNTLNTPIPDYYWFCDCDCIPLRKDFIDIFYEKIKDKNSIFGPALATNHRSFQDHIYAAAFCLSFSKKVYLDLGCPLMTDTIERSDNSQEITWESQLQGKTVSMIYPTSFHKLTTQEMSETGNPEFFKLGKYFSYGLGTQYGDMLFHGFMANIKRGNELFIQKCKEVINHNQSIDCIVVSVNCSDYLELTLPENIKHFNNYYVATVATDLKTIDICQKYGARCIICKDPHDINGFQFDKGFCIQEVLKSIADRNRWILLLDADIILPANFNNLLNIDILDKNTLYGASRCFAWDYNEYLEYQNGKPINSFEKIDGGWGCGYFMLFNLNSDKIKNLPLEKIYPNGNIETDMVLLERFHPQRFDVGKLDFNVLHLGGHSLFENGRIDNRGRFDCVKGKTFKEIGNVKNLLNS